MLDINFLNYGLPYIPKVDARIGIIRSILLPLTANFGIKNHNNW